MRCGSRARSGSGGLTVDVTQRTGSTTYSSYSSSRKAGPGTCRRRANNIGSSLAR